MGLKEGACKTADKGGGENGIGRHREEGLQERKTGGFQGRKRPKPLFFVPHKKLKPPAQLGQGDGESFAEFLQGRQLHEILRQDA